MIVASLREDKSKDHISFLTDRQQFVTGLWQTRERYSI